MKVSYHVKFGVSSCVTGRAQLLTPARTCLRASVRVAAQKCTLARIKGATDHASAFAPVSNRASAGRAIGDSRQYELFRSAGRAALLPRAFLFSRQSMGGIEPTRCYLLTVFTSTNVMCTPRMCSRAVPRAGHRPGVSPEPPTCAPERCPGLGTARGRPGAVPWPKGHPPHVLRSGALAQTPRH